MSAQQFRTNYNSLFFKDGKPLALKGSLFIDIENGPYLSMGNLYLTPTTPIGNSPIFFKDGKPLTLKGQVFIELENGASISMENVTMTSTTRIGDMAHQRYSFLKENPLDEGKAPSEIPFKGNGVVKSEAPKDIVEVEGKQIERVELPKDDEIESESLKESKDLEGNGETGQVSDTVEPTEQSVRSILYRDNWYKILLDKDSEVERIVNTKTDKELSLDSPYAKTILKRASL